MFWTISDRCGGAFGGPFREASGELHVKTRVNMRTHADLYVKTRIWDDVKRRINASRTLRVYVFLYVYMCFYIQVRLFDCLILQLN